MSMSSVEAFAAAQAKYAQTFETHLENGVNFISRDVYIEPGVVIAPGATILPGTILRGATVIEAGHYATEAPVTAVLAAWLRERFPGVGCAVFDSGAPYDTVGAAAP